MPQHPWRSENNFKEMVFTFSMSPSHHIQAARLCSKHLYPPSPLGCPWIYLMLYSRSLAILKTLFLLEEQGLLFFFPRIENLIIFSVGLCIQILKFR